MTHTVRLHLMVGEVWIPADSVLDDPTEWLRECRSSTAYNLQGGFFVSVDGRPWSDESTVDQFDMTATWVPGLIALLGGARTAQVWDWEESNLSLTRDGDSIILEDIHPSGQVIRPAVRVNLVDFATDIVRESQKLEGLVGLLHASLDVQQRSATQFHGLPPASFSRQVAALSEQIGY